MYVHLPGRLRWTPSCCRPAKQTTRVSRRHTHAEGCDSDCEQRSGTGQTHLGLAALLERDHTLRNRGVVRPGDRLVKRPLLLLVAEPAEELVRLNYCWINCRDDLRNQQQGSVCYQQHALPLSFGLAAEGHVPTLPLLPLRGVAQCVVRITEQESSVNSRTSHGK